MHLVSINHHSNERTFDETCAPVTNVEIPAKCASLIVDATVVADYSSRILFEEEGGV